MPKPLNIGLIGVGFMGRAHSNAYRKVNHFFKREHVPVLKACCARPQEADKMQAFAEAWGYESCETDWKKLIQRKDIELIDICAPGGGFMIDTGALVDDAKPDNLMAMFETAETYGSRR